MYNENQKNRYIEYKNSITILPENYLKTQFKFSEKFEEELGKDLCDFNEEEIKDFYKARNFKATGSLDNLNSQLKEYTNWCIIEGLVKDHQNHYSFIKSNELKECVNKIKKQAGYVTKKQLIKSINRLSNASDKYIFLAAFEGVMGKNFDDILNVSEKDLKGNLLKLKSGKEIIVSDLLRDLIIESCNTYKYYQPNKVMPLTGDKVIKQKSNTRTDSERNAARNLYKTIWTRRDEIGLSYVTINSIFLSGKYSYTIELYEKEKRNNNDLSLFMFLLEHKHIIESKYDRIHPIEAYIRTLEEYLS